MSNSPNTYAQQFIAKNWSKMTDEDMSKRLRISTKQVQIYRLRLGKSRKLSLKKPENLALAIEMFANGSGLVMIGKHFGIAPSTVSALITKHFFYKQRSYDTITLVAESKINYETTTA